MGFFFLWLKRIEDLEKHVNADDVVSYIWYVVKFIRKVSDFEQKKKQIELNIESAQNVILSNCTKPRTGQLKNIGIWG